MLTHLLIMRHAKSSWKDPDLPDHQRPLNSRGRKAASAMGDALYKRGFAPDLIWSSDAQRTRETALGLVRAIPGPQTIMYGPEFYHASASDILLTCQDNGQPNVSRLMLLVHNPGCAALFEHFSGQFDSFPTATCAIFEKKTPPAPQSDQPSSSDQPLELDSWLLADHWKLADLIHPRSLSS